MHSYVDFFIIIIGMSITSTMLASLSFTDLIFRLSVIEQLADYDKKVTNELQELIKANNEKYASFSS